MSRDRVAEGTKIDQRMARSRPKEGIGLENTGLFLRIEEGAEKGRVYTLSSGGVHLIGREGADIDLDDPKVSRKHAEIGLYGPEAYVLRDLASTNGSFVNGRRVTEKTKLKHWDLIRIGDTVLRFAEYGDSIPVG